MRNMVIVTVREVAEEYDLCDAKPGVHYDT